MEEYKNPNFKEYEQIVNLGDFHNCYKKTAEEKYKQDFGGIYIWLNTKSKKFYIGSSTKILWRTQRHINDLRTGKHKNEYFLNSWKKHGEKVWNVYIIKKVKRNSKESDIKYRNRLQTKYEQKYLDLFSPFGKRGYNLDKKASGGMVIQGEFSFNRKRAISSYETFLKIVNELETNFKPLSQIAREYNVTRLYVINIYNKHIYKELLKDRVFKTRNKREQLRLKYDTKIRELLAKGYNNFEIIREINPEYPIGLLNLLKTDEYNSNPGVKEVHQFTLDGIYLKTYKNFLDASKQNNFNQSCIAKCAKSEEGCYYYKNFIWRLDRDFKADDIQKISEKTEKKFRPVIEYFCELPIACFKNITEAERVTKHDRNDIGKCCKGKKDSVAGFIWKYADEVPQEDIDYLLDLKYNKNINITNNNLE